MRTPLPRLPPLYRFASPRDADETLTFEMKPWARVLLPAEDAALRDYKEAFGRQINRALLEPDGGDPLLLGVAATLAQALGKAEFPLTVETWRAAGPEEWWLFKRLRGGWITSQTFISTSLMESVARELAAAESRSVIRIIVPAGTKGAAYVHPFPDYQHEEFEILLNIGTKLRILRNGETQLVLLAGEDEGYG